MKLPLSGGCNCGAVCGECGSAMFGSNPSHPEPIGIRMGTFDGDPGIRSSVRQFVAYAAAWESLPEDGLP